MSTGRPPGPFLETALLDYPWVVIRFRCHYCERGGDSRLAACAVRYGAHATLGSLLARFRSGCPWAPDNPMWKPRKYGHKCGAYLPDLSRGGPPDLPPSLTGLTLIEGGKESRLPAEPAPLDRRRRIGEAGDEG
jgi:hypothetical protein